MALYGIPVDKNSIFVLDEYEEICRGGKCGGALYYNKKTGKFKLIGGCYINSICFFTHMMRLNVRKLKNFEEIEKSKIVDSYMGESKDE